MFTDKQIVKRSVRAKRLPDYLSKADKERGINFASQLLLKATNRQLNEVLFHETQHLKDGRSIALKAASLGSATASVVSIYTASVVLIDWMGVHGLPELAGNALAFGGSFFGGRFVDYYLFNR